MNRRRVSRSNLILPPTEARQQNPPEAQSEQGLEGNPDHTDGTPLGIPGGDENSGHFTSAALPRPPPRLELDESNTRLTKVSGPDPEYTQQALDHDVEGTMLVKCVVTIYGVVQRCRVLSSLPFMDRAVIDALERRRYKPYISNGNPVDIDYTFMIKLNLPR